MMVIANYENKMQKSTESLIYINSCDIVALQCQSYSSIVSSHLHVW